MVHSVTSPLYTSAHKEPKNTPEKKICLKSLISRVFHPKHPKTCYFTHKKVSLKVDKELVKIGFSDKMQQAHPDIKSKYPDAIQFLKLSGVGTFFERTGLCLQIDENGQLLFPSEDKMIPWEELKAKIFASGPWDQKTIPTGWRFDTHGLCPISTTKWTKLIPTSKEEPHPGRWYIDLMTTTEGLNHAWVRLVSEDGDVTSVGMIGNIYKLFMFRGSVANLHCPDYREFSPEEHRQTRIAISKENYKRAIAKVEADQNDKNLYFNLLSRNCSVYAFEVASEVGIELDNTEFPTQMMNREWINKIGITFSSLLLKIIDKTTYVVRAILGSITMIFAGAWYENSEVKATEKLHKHKWKEAPNKPFRSIKSFFDGTNYHIHSTFKLGEWQHFVEKYRSVRLKALEKEISYLKRNHKLQDSQLEVAEKNWIKLKEEIEFEAPPTLKKGELFLLKTQKIKINDVRSRALAVLAEAAKIGK